MYLKGILNQKYSCIFKSVVILSLFFVKNIQAQDSSSIDGSILAEVCEDRTLFPIRYNMSYRSMLNRFVRSGGDPDDVVYLDSMQTIIDQFKSHSWSSNFKYNSQSRNEMGYKFALSKNCELSVSRYEYKFRRIPSRNVHHHLVAKGDEVYSAGAIVFFHDGNDIEKVVIANRSSRFCPTFRSLKVVEKYLRKLGIKKSDIKRVDNTRPMCQGL